MKRNSSTSCSPGAGFGLSLREATVAQPRSWLWVELKGVMALVLGPGSLKRKFFNHLRFTNIFKKSNSNSKKSVTYNAKKSGINEGIHVLVTIVFQLGCLIFFLVCVTVD